MKCVAIDGPAGAGKSTIARKAATKLGFVYVDTGALYRTIGLFVLRQGIKTDDAAKIVSLLPNMTVELNYVNGEQRVFLNGEDVSDHIRTPEASMAASSVSAIPEVRSFLLSLQQDLAKKNNVIMDGRDIGTVVLPHADVKIFLTASAEERAKRRCNQLTESGMTVEYNTILEEIKQRDHNDSTRAIAPLKPADDAIMVDTSDNTLEESIALLESVILKNLEAVKR